MNISTLSATQWALTNRATLHAVTRALEEYMQAKDTGNEFEKTVTYKYLLEKYAEARDLLDKGVWQ